MKRSQKGSSQGVFSLPYWGLALGNFGFLGCSFLRESQSFWTNAGGYPVVLRDLVRLGYYPLLASLLFVHLVLALKGRGPVARLLNLLVFIPLGLGLVLAWSNNVINLWQGQPLHWHP